MNSSVCLFFGWKYRLDLCVLYTQSWVHTISNQIVFGYFCQLFGEIYPRRFGENVSHTNVGENVPLHDRNVLVLLCSEALKKKKDKRSSSIVAPENFYWFFSFCWRGTITDDDRAPKFRLWIQFACDAKKKLSNSQHSVTKVTYIDGQPSNRQK